jgi:hypothetical protein
MVGVWEMVSVIFPLLAIIINQLKTTFAEIPLNGVSPQADCITGEHINVFGLQNMYGMAR